MKRMMLALLAVTALGASSGCCCLESWWYRPWGCRSCGGCNDCGCGCGDGGCYDQGCCGGYGGGYGGGGCGGGGCGCGGGGGGPYGQQGYGGGPGYAQGNMSMNGGPQGNMINGPQGGYMNGPQGYAQCSPQQGCSQQGCGPRANSCCTRKSQYQQYGPSQYAEDVGPPTGAVTYPYYTNRGPRDFLARNPQSIGQ